MRRGSGCKRLFINCDLEWRRIPPAEALAKALAQAVGQEVGGRAQAGREEGVNSALWGSQPVGEGVGGPPCCPWGLPGQPLHSDQPTGLGLAEGSSWGEAQPLPQGYRKGNAEGIRGPWG